MEPRPSIDQKMGSNVFCDYGKPLLMEEAYIPWRFSVFLSIGLFFFSFIIAWPSNALEVLKSDSSPIGRSITKNEGSLIGSLPTLGSLVAVPITGWMSDTMGRKRCAILIALCYVLGWSILATAKSIVFVLISRVLLGYSSGASIVLYIPFVSEIGSDSTRGFLMSISIFIFTSGTLVSYLTGWLMSYQAINYFGLTLSVAFVVLLSCLKETPVYLISKRNDKDALKSLNFYRGVSNSTKEVLEEFNYLKKQNSSHGNQENYELSPEKEKLAGEATEDQETSAWKILRTSKCTQRALVMTIVNILLLSFGGTIGVTAYAGPLFSMGAPGLSKHMCSILLSLAFVIGSLLSTVTCGLLKRRTLYISSAVFSSILLAVLASLLRWVWGPEWMVPAAVLAFSTIYQMGVGTVPLVQMGEIFVPKVKSLVSVIATTVMSIANFVVLACFTPVVDAFGLDGMFLMFSMECCFAAIVAYFTMKETKGVPVEEIQEMFDNGYLYTRKRSK